MRSGTRYPKVIEQFGKNVRAARKRLHIRQEDLADLMDMSRISIINIEAGRQRPVLEDILKLCVILKTRPDKLLPPLPTMELKRRGAKFKW